MSPRRRTEPIRVEGCEPSTTGQIYLPLHAHPKEVRCVPVEGYPPDIIPPDQLGDYDDGDGGEWECPYCGVLFDSKEGMKSVNDWHDTTCEKFPQSEDDDE